jgi:hypothetical protein
VEAAAHGRILREEAGTDSRVPAKRPGGGRDWL